MKCCVSNLPLRATFLRPLVTSETINARPSNNLPDGICSGVDKKKKKKKYKYMCHTGKWKSGGYKVLLED